MEKRSDNKPTTEEQIEVVKTKTKPKTPKAGKKRRTNHPNGSNKPRETKKHFNNPMWYAATPALLTDSASLSFSEATGTELKLGLHAQYGTHTANSVPGVMALRIVPTIGKSLTAADACNVAARNIYSFVRHANAGSRNYDAPDLMMYLLAMDNLYSMHAWLTRAYGVARVFAQKNRTIPTALFRAMNIDYDSVVKDLAGFRYYINYFGKRIGSMCIPSSMSYFARHAWMYSDVYKDGDSPKSQNYLLTPAGFHMYEGYTSETGGLLKFKPIEEETEFNLLSLQSYCDAFLAKVLLDEDMNIMSGDILKAFGDGNVMKLHSVAEDYTVEPVAALDMLSQIQNATILPSVNDEVAWNGSLDIVQTTSGLIRSRVTYSDSTRQWKGNKLFSLLQNDPSPADVMVASRLTSIIGGGETMDIFPLDYGSEIVCGANVYQYKYSSAGATYSSTPYQFGELTTTDGLTSKLLNLSQFSMHPEIRIFSYNEDFGEVDKFLGFLFEVDNYTVILERELKKMHETALLSQFDVPQMGTFGHSRPSR